MTKRCDTREGYPFSTQLPVGKGDLEEKKGRRSKGEGFSDGRWRIRRIRSSDAGEKRGPQDSNYKKKRRSIRDP